ncbi:FAD-binding oxidoreductase [Aquisalimonas sp.]|uniref:NAD(P)/FAD-dependent oxidoreductase n=1 Tax=Aquisalimonas sp. TaxID=1872621 RepID=UPI0025BF4275|nr:FAD-binding oxidoreductase [Aquisalimonas sp.]
MAHVPELDEPREPGSIWARSADPSLHWRPLVGDASAGTVVVGGGFTGLSAALHLAERGEAVVVLDAAEPGWGASGRNGGQVIPGLKADPQALEACYGPEWGARVVRTVGGAAENLFELVARYQIDCHARQAGWIQPAHCAGAMVAVRGRAQQWRQRGVDARLLDGDEVRGLLGCAPSVYVGGWLDPRGGSIQPLALARGLARVAADMGVAVHGHARATQLRRAAGLWEVATPAGRVRAQRLVLATNGYTDGLWPGLARSIVPVYSQQIATAPLAPALRERILPHGQVASDTRRLMRYYRLDAAGRLLMGGRGPFRERPGMADTAVLYREACRLFPGIEGVALETTWAGRVAMTADHLPHLHVLADNAYAALGYNGRGVAMAVTMGRLLADLVTGASVHTLDYPTTPPRPLPLHALRRPAIAALTAWYRLLDYRDERRVRA